MVAHCPLTSFLCLAAALLMAGAVVGHDQGCPDGWAPFGTRCFKFFDSPLTWTKAEISCQSNGAHLASIHSAEENTFVVDLIKKGSGGEYRWCWFGGHNAVQEKLWMWTDGSVWDYSNWSPGQPNNWKLNERFLLIFSRDADWVDYKDSLTINYICAKDAPC